MSIAKIASSERQSVSIVGKLAKHTIEYATEIIQTGRNVNFADIRILRGNVARMEVALSSSRNEIDPIEIAKNQIVVSRIKALIAELEVVAISDVDEWISRGADENELIRTVMTMDRDVVPPFMFYFARVIPANRFLRVDYNASSNTLLTLNLDGVDLDMPQNVSNEIDAVIGRISYACKKDSHIRIAVLYSGLKAFTAIQCCPAISPMITVSEWGKTSSTNMFQTAREAISYLCEKKKEVEKTGIQ